MLKSLLHWRIRAFERRYDYDAGFLHELVDIDIAGLFKIQRLTGIGQHHGGLPASALYAAKLAAAMHEDCGPCAQIVINMALEAGVEGAQLAALAAGTLERVPADTAAAFRFARAVLERGELEAARAAVIEHFGARGPACLGLALSVGRTYPVLKRAMGHAQTCVALDVGGVPIAAAH